MGLGSPKKVNYHKAIAKIPRSISSVIVAAATFQEALPAAVCCLRKRPFDSFVQSDAFNCPVLSLQTIWTRDGIGYKMQMHYSSHYLNNAKVIIYEVQMQCSSYYLNNSKVKAIIDEVQMQYNFHYLDNSKVKAIIDEVQMQ
ncbi:hypothetical protein AVEN_201768-1 [Araneus ventricosus]|uniref:Uncharacterized protein n=1 Tax=Araneus ventricosus TaxID=182803 RepID=A0A4Y2J0F5_ARAVE|nr:hypothetical protein AVEN_201768-1 [Araneus ventricosus]